VQWSALTGDATGQSTITNYEIYWDAGTNNDASYALIVNSTSSETFSSTITSGVTSGTLYRFKYRARNVFGVSDFSSVTSIYAAVAPSGLSAPTTTASGTNVVIDWNAPSDNGGLAITSYTVQIKDSGSNWVTVTECSESAATILSSTICTLSASTLTSSTYSLTAGTSTVEARVTAT
jgi:hypothetical protein